MDELKKHKVKMILEEMQQDEDLTEEDILEYIKDKESPDDMFNEFLRS